MALCQCAQIFLGRFGKVPQTLLNHSGTMPQIFLGHLDKLSGPKVISALRKSVPKTFYCNWTKFLQNLRDWGKCARKFLEYLDKVPHKIIMVIRQIDSNP
jgi:hypothetical protein